MNTSDLMLSGAPLPDAARLTGPVPRGPGCGAKPISDATAEERAGGAAAFAGHLRRIDGESAERGSGDGQGLGEEGRAGNAAVGRAGERASAAEVEQGEAPGSSVAKAGNGSSGGARLAGQTASLAIDGENGKGTVSLGGSPSPSAPASTTAALASGGGIVAASAGSAVPTGGSGEAPLSVDSPTSGPLPSGARLADGPAMAAAADPDDRADTVLLAVDESIASGPDEIAMASIVARDDALTAAARDAIASEGDDVDAVSIESPVSISTSVTAAAAGDDRQIDIPAGGSASGVSPTSFSVNGAAAIDVPTLEGSDVAPTTARAAEAAASMLRAEESGATAAAVARASADVAASASPTAADTSPLGSSPTPTSASVSGGALATSSGERGANPLADARTDAAASLARQPAAAESPAAALDTSGPTSSAGTPSAGAPLVSSEATFARRATAEGVAVSPASEPRAVNSSTNPTAADATVIAAPTALLAAGAAGTRGRAPGVDPLSGADAAKDDAPMPVLVADVLRKRQVETTHRVEAFRDGLAMNVAAERRIGPIASEASPLADAIEGEAPAQRSVSLPSASATAPLASLHTQTPGVPLATRVDMSPSPAPIAPHNVSLGSGADATELAAGVRWTLGEGRGQALVNVTPAGLGPVSIRVTLEGDQMNVSILASQAGAREALESLVPRMRDQLAAEGHERVQVDVSSGRQDGQARAGMQAQDEGGRSGTGRATGDDADERDVESLAERGASMRDGAGRDGAGARSLIDAWA